jgi:D-glycero-D-manno-heptose 1,7-bisphosphate phosphatase
MLPALFLDRDGVIIENRERYVRSLTDVAYYPTALLALAKIQPFPYKVVIVTNQSAVGRGMITLETAERINLEIQKTVVQAGGRIDAIFTCPHAPADGCACRKPKPGLLLQAAESLSLDLPRSILMGDALDDLSAGHAAGVGKLILLRTGRGSAQLELPAAARLSFPFKVFDSLFDAIHNLPEFNSPLPTQSLPEA